MLPSTTPIGTCQPYLSFSAGRTLQNASYCLGVLHNHKQGWNDLRARVQIIDSKTDSFIYLKSFYSTTKAGIGILLAGNPMRKLLQKNDIEIGCMVMPDNWLWLRLYT